MDVKVDVRNVLPGGHDSANNAAAWLREHLNIDPKYTIFEQFEEYFNCRIDVDDRADAWMCPNKIVFSKPSELTAFVLRWT